MNTTLRKQESLIETIWLNRWYALLSAILCSILLAAIIAIIPSKYDSEAIASFNVLSPENVFSEGHGISNQNTIATVVKGSNESNIPAAAEFQIDASTDSNESNDMESSNEALIHQQMLTRAMTAYEILVSRELAMQVVRAVGPERILQPQSFVDELRTNFNSVDTDYSTSDSEQQSPNDSIEELACNAVLNMARIQSDQSSYLVRFRIRSGDADLSHAILAAYITEYQKNDLIRPKYEGQLSHLAAQHKQNEARKMQCQLAIDACLAEYDNVDLEGRIGLIENRIRETDSNLEAINEEIATTTDQIDQFAADLASLQKIKTTPSIAINLESDPEQPDLRIELVALQNQEAELSEIYLDNHPGLKSVRSKIATTQELIQLQDQQGTQIVETVNQTSEAEISALKRKLKDAENRRRNLNRRLKWTRERRSEYSKSATELRQAEIRLAELRSAFDEAKRLSDTSKLAMSRADQIAKFAKSRFHATEWSTPTIQRQSVSPNRLFWLAMTVTASIIFGVTVGICKRVVPRNGRAASTPQNPKALDSKVDLASSTKPKNADSAKGKSSELNNLKNKDTNSSSGKPSDSVVTWVAKTR